MKIDSFSGFYVMGVDPGVHGGLAVLHSYTGTPAVVEAFTPGMSEQEFVDTIGGAFLLLEEGGRRDVFLEKVGFIRGDGGKGAFTFGRVDGLIRGSLRARRAVIHEVYPMVWQSRLSCLTGGNKNVSKRRAQAMFPRTKVTHSIADALLIAEYGRLILTKESREAGMGV